MNPLPPLSIEAPDRLDAVPALLASGARVLAGGTDLLPAMKMGLLPAPALVSLRRLPQLRGVVERDGGLSIGAATPLLDLRGDPRIAARYPALAAAAATVATRTIQGMATLGGNVLLDARCAFYNQPAGWREAIGGCLKCEGHVCHVAPRGKGCYAAHSADTVPVLWLLGARVELLGCEGLREMPIAALYPGEDGRRPHSLAPDELLTRVLLPRPAEAVAHHKVRVRGAIDFGALLVAVQRRGAGARAVLSAVGPAPIELSVDRADDLPAAAHALARPLPTHLHDTPWRRQMVEVAVRRALAQLG